MHSEHHYFLTSLYLPQIGPTRLRRWIQHFGNITQLFSASNEHLTAAGLTETQIQSIKNPNWQAAEEDLKWCEKNNCHVIPYTSANYPKLLNELPDGPLILFVKGQPELLSKPQLAIVGSRNPTPIGQELAEHFAYYLASAGLVITSGLALGIDAAAHAGTLKAGKPTLAVCGTGLSKVYPRSNQALAEKIIETGALVSEFPPATQAAAKHFPLRNRLISGLSTGVLVVEAALKSGSLITAQYAAEQGREVFAIPGSIHNPLSKGCHKLIRQGAKLVETAADIVEELGPLTAVTAEPPPNNPALSSKKQQLLKQIGYEITALDAIIKRSGLTLGEVSSMLISLELEGYVTGRAEGYSRTSLSGKKTR